MTDTEARAREYADKSPWQVDAESLADFATQEVQRERIAAVREFIEKVEQRVYGPISNPVMRLVFKEMFGEEL